MPRAVARQLEFYADEGLDIALTPIALTGEQVKGYRLPRVPIKASDAGRRNFEAEYGEGAVELDASKPCTPASWPASSERPWRRSGTPTTRTGCRGRRRGGGDRRGGVDGQCTGDVTDEMAEIRQAVERSRSSTGPWPSRSMPSYGRTVSASPSCAASSPSAPRTSTWSCPSDRMPSCRRTIAGGCTTRSARSSNSSTPTTGTGTGPRYRRETNHLDAQRHQVRVSRPPR